MKASRIVRTSLPAGIVLALVAVGCAPSYENQRPPVDQLDKRDRGLQSKDVVQASDSLAMKVRELATSVAEQFLDCRGCVRVVVPAESGIYPEWALFIPLQRFVRDRLIVATDTEVFLLDRERHAMKIRGELYRGQRHSLIIPRLTGMLYTRIDLGNDRLWIHRRFYGDARRLPLVDN